MTVGSFAMSVGRNVLVFAMIVSWKESSFASREDSLCKPLHLPFPNPLIPILEEYLTFWRPILTKQTNNIHPYVFLNQAGKPWDPKHLYHRIRMTVFAYTGKFFHPHIIRSIWATEWIRDTHGDFYTAAIMLNDRLETVIANYAHLLEEDVAEKAYQLIEERYGQVK
jgi:site-specific recombinase XerD